jgi:hypothetical protein
MEVSGVYSRKEPSKVSIAPIRACAMRYDRSSSMKGVSVVPGQRTVSPTGVLGLELFQFAQT